MMGDMISQARKEFVVKTYWCDEIGAWQFEEVYGPFTFAEAQRLASEYRDCDDEAVVERLSRWPKPQGETV